MSLKPQAEWSEDLKIYVGKLGIILNKGIKKFGFLNQFIIVLDTILLHNL